MSYNFPSADQTGFTLGQNAIYAAPTDNLNTLITRINAVGGGTIYLGATTYTLTASIVGLSNISLIGVSNSTTTIDCGGLYNIGFAGTNVYTTGTIASITSFVVVTGTGTAWLAHVLPKSQIFIGTRWYQIASVVNDTTLILAEGFGDANISFPTTYRIAVPVVNVVLEEFTITNSSGTGLTLTDERFLIMGNVRSVGNNIGFNFTNISEIDIKNTYAVESVSNGFELTNAGLTTAEGLVTIGNGGTGVVVNNLSAGAFFFCASDANGNGVSLSNIIGCEFAYSSSGNSGIALEMVNCSSCFINPGIFTGNGSDGVKLTSGNVKNIIGSLTSNSNGGWGINIADGTNVSNVIDAVITTSNSSGTIQDNGTGTSIIGQVVNVPGNAATATALQNARTIGGVSFNGTANITVASATGGFTISGGDLALGANNLTLTGSIASTGSRVTKGWFTDLAVTNAITGSVTGSAASVSNATLTTALTVNGGTLTLTANVANTSVLTIGAGAVSVSGSNTGDQSLFSNVPVSGQTTVTANSATTALTFVAGSNVTITTDNTAKSITFAASGSAQVYPGAGMAVSTGSAWGTSKATPTGGVVGTTDTQVLTNKDLTSGTNTFPTFNQNTSGSAAKWTTARNLAGNSVDGSADIAFANKFVVQGTADTGLSAAQFTGALATGIVKNTTTTGVLTIAANTDLPVGDATHAGAMPTPPNDTTTYLRGDATWATVSAVAATFNPNLQVSAANQTVPLNSSIFLFRKYTLTGTAQCLNHGQIIIKN